MRLASLSALALVVALLLGVVVMPGTAAAQTVAEPTPTELTYLADTRPYRERLSAYQEQLLTLQRAAAEGQLDSIALADLGDLTRSLFAARQAFEEAEPSVRLDQYDRTIKLGLERAYEGTVLLLRAQRSESIAESAALIREAGIQTGSSTRLFKDATDELQMQLPIAAL